MNFIYSPWLSLSASTAYCHYWYASFPQHTACTDPLLQPSLLTVSYNAVYTLIIVETASVVLCIMHSIFFLNYMCLLDSALLPLEWSNYTPAESKGSCSDLYRQHPRRQNL